MKLRSNENLALLLGLGLAGLGASSCSEETARLLETQTLALTGSGTMVGGTLGIAEYYAASAGGEPVATAALNITMTSSSCPTAGHRPSVSPVGRCSMHPPRVLRGRRPI